MIRSVQAAWILIALVSTPAAADPTGVIVRVISQDAKFVGDSMGGAEVVLRDAATGVVLAQGVTTGGTGDTALIMASTGRSPLRATDSAAAYRATVDIDRPTLVRVEVRGPLGFPQTQQRTSSERWLIPGNPATMGDGWVVELPGLAIRMLGNWQDGFRRGTTTTVTAEVQLMCGCPITQGGLWNADEYEVFLEVRRAGEVALRLPLAFAEAPGKFRAEWTPEVVGDVEATVIARNRVTGNTGVLREMASVR